MRCRSTPWRRSASRSPANCPPLQRSATGQQKQLQQQGAAQPLPAGLRRWRRARWRRTSQQQSRRWWRAAWGRSVCMRRQRAQWRLRTPRPWPWSPQLWTQRRRNRRQQRPLRLWAARGQRRPGLRRRRPARPKRRPHPAHLTRWPQPRRRRQTSQPRRRRRRPAWRLRLPPWAALAAAATMMTSLGILETPTTDLGTLGWQSLRPRRPRPRRRGTPPRRLRQTSRSWRGRHTWMRCWTHGRCLAPAASLRRRPRRPRRRGAAAARWPWRRRRRLWTPTPTPAAARSWRATACPCRWARPAGPTSSRACRASTRW
ncbi:MAG: hypothetical protein J3K34DRAFT_526335, partial [Monoraphidium minutum]